MDTWATQAAAHVTLTSGISAAAVPVLGSASLDGFALGLSCAGLAFAALHSPWKLRSPGRPADVQTRPVRRSRAHRRRNQDLSAVLAAGAAEPDRAGLSRPYENTEPGPALAAAPAGHRRPDQSRMKQRVTVLLTQMLGDDADAAAEPAVTSPDDEFLALPEPAEPRASSGYLPRHAAPPASFSARLVNPRLPGFAGKSSHAAW